MKIAKPKLEAAARAYLKEKGFEYDGKSLVDCARSKDPNVYNPRAREAVDAARRILSAAV